MTLPPDVAMAFSRSSPPVDGCVGVRVTIALEANGDNRRANPVRVESTITWLMTALAAEAKVFLEAYEDWDKWQRGNT